MNTASSQNLTSLDFTSGYFPPFGAFDEMKAPLGFVRPHWQSLMNDMQRLGIAGLQERHEGARQLLREHGVTYNFTSEGKSAERIWDLDILPLLIDPAEWEGVEAGLIQRTRLLNLVLADIYGPQNLLKRGLLPPALLHSNPGFLRSCHGIRPSRDLYLSFHAVDLTRAPDGKWWVLSDRTQVPTGDGYALENRAILSRILAAEFRDSRVRRLGGFFNQYREGLLTLSPRKGAPKIVVMTPGPFTATYFEHAYLARHLGFPLVEGNDCTVRDRRVFLKTLEGLQQIDVIIRRVDDAWCDPLELRDDSVLGIPGLVDAYRAGNVAISNAPGSGAVETTAILAFLPALSRHLLGEKLLIPNIATWWCGQESERDYTLRSLNSLVIKRAFSGGQQQPVFGEMLNSSDLEALASRIRRTPHAFVAQERVPLSTSPVWNGKELEARPLILRCYICAVPGGFTVMPGGLTRVSPSPDSPVVSSRYGGGSKDTWVGSPSPEGEHRRDEPPAPLQGTESASSGIPSRLGENLFWLARYAERIEDTSRLLRTILNRLVGEGSPIEELELNGLIQWLSHETFIPEFFREYFDRENLIPTLNKLIFDHATDGGIQELLSKVAFVTSCVRDRLSSDTWRILNQLQTDFPEAKPIQTPGFMLQTLHGTILELAAFSGLEMENMSRGHDWLFLDIGRRLERSINLLNNLRAVLATGSDKSVLIPLLEYTDSTMTYRRRYLAQPEASSTFTFLLSDSANPRSLVFQFNALRENLEKLPRAGENRSQAVRLQELMALLSDTDASELTLPGGDGGKELRHRLNGLYEGCRNLSDLLSANYFSHVVALVS